MCRVWDIFSLVITAKVCPCHKECRVVSLAYVYTLYTSQASFCPRSPTQPLLMEYQTVCSSLPVVCCTLFWGLTRGVSSKMYQSLPLGIIQYFLRVFHFLDVQKSTQLEFSSLNWLFLRNVFISPSSPHLLEGPWHEPLEHSHQNSLFDS